MSKFRFKRTNSKRKNSKRKNSKRKNLRAKGKTGIQTRKARRETMTELVPTDLVPNIVFTEGGDSYRPMIIIPRLDDVFPMENICFFKTSGRSNGSSFGGMWIPTVGFVNKKFIDNFRKDATENNIIKGIDIDLDKTWAYEFLSDYLRETYGLELDKINSLQVYIHNDAIQQFIDLTPFITLYETFISSYFSSLNELRMSACLGSGLWVTDPEFINLREFLRRDIGPPSSAILNTAAYFDKAESEFAPLAIGLEESKNFLIEHNAQICIGECKKPKGGRGPNPYNTYILAYGLLIKQLLRSVFSVQRMYAKEKVPRAPVFTSENIRPVLDLYPSLAAELKISPKS